MIQCPEVVDELGRRAGRDARMGPPAAQHRLEETVVGQQQDSEIHGQGTPEPEVVDAKALDRLRSLSRASGEDLLSELIDDFLEHAPARLAGLRQALDRGDADQLRNRAHFLKGSVGYLGARGLHSLCAQVEEQARRGALGPARSLLPEVESELDRVRRRLRAELPGAGREPSPG